MATDQNSTPPALTPAELVKIIGLVEYTAAKSALNWRGDEWSDIIGKLRATLLGGELPGARAAGFGEAADQTRQSDEQYLSSVLRTMYERGAARRPMGDASFLDAAATILSQLDGYSENV